MNCNYSVLVFLILVVFVITYLNRPKETFNTLEEYNKSRKPNKFKSGFTDNKTLNTKCDDKVNISAQVKKMEEEICSKNNLSDINDIINNRYECNNMNNIDIHENINKNSWCQYTKNNPIVQKASQVEKPYNSVDSLNFITKKPNPNGYSLINNNYPFSIDNINMNMKNNIDNLNNKTDKHIESNKISPRNTNTNYKKY